MKPRALRRWGSKRYARDEMRTLMREWAKAKRVNKTTGLDERERHVSFGQVIGARGALYAVGALRGEQYEAVSRRIERINRAKVTRRPFVPKAAARPAGPVVCSFGDELAGKAPPTYGPAAEGRAA